MLWNAESIMNKKTELEHILHEKDIDICCIQETHLNSNETFKIQGYQCFRSNRIDRNIGRNSDSCQKQHLCLHH